MVNSPSPARRRVRHGSIRQSRCCHEFNWAIVYSYATCPRHIRILTANRAHNHHQHQRHHQYRHQAVSNRRASCNNLCMRVSTSVGNAPHLGPLQSRRLGSAWPATFYSLFVSLYKHSGNDGRRRCNCKHWWACCGCGSCLKSFQIATTINGRHSEACEWQVLCALCVFALRINLKDIEKIGSFGKALS